MGRSAAVSLRERSSRESVLRQAILASEELICREAEKDPYVWMVSATKTKDEQDPDHPYKNFPTKPYIKRMVEYLTANVPRSTILGTYKSRTMIASWTHAAASAHRAFTIPATRVLIQSEDESRAVAMVSMAKTLWDNSHDRLKAKWKLWKRMDLQAYNTLQLDNDSVIIGMVGTPTKIKSSHPTLYIADEGGIMKNLDECIGEALGARTLALWILSSSYLGHMNDMYEACSEISWRRFLEGGGVTGVKMVDDYEGRFHLDTSPPELDLELPGMKLFRHPEKQMFFMRLHYSADPDLTKEKVIHLKKQYPSEAIWEREMEINPREAQGALVFPEFNIKDHVVHPSELPDSLTPWMAIDPHPRTPHAFLWVGLDRYDDIYVYRDYWPSIAYGSIRRIRDDERENQFAIMDYVEALAKIEGGKIKWHYEKGSSNPEYGDFTEGEPIVRRFMDQAGKAFRASAESEQLETYAARYRRYGISCFDPKKSHQVGEDAIREALKPRRHDIRGMSSRLKISSKCREVINELSAYRYKESSDNIEREQNQKTIEFRCHFVDLLRYLLTASLYYDSRYTFDPKRKR